jgi:hypothetical protein
LPESFLLLFLNTVQNIKIELFEIVGSNFFCFSFNRLLLASAAPLLFDAPLLFAASLLFAATLIVCFPFQSSAFPCSIICFSSFNRLLLASAAPLLVVSKRKHKGSAEI